MAGRSQVDSRRLVGRYEILLPIASGGMASVHLARASGAAGFERLFAVKLCHPHLLHDQAFVAMFLDEARMAALIRHPNVVATVDLGTEGEELFLAMEYVEGGALSRLCQAAKGAPDKRLPLKVALRIALDVLSGLHAAHEVCAVDGTPLHLVHRDLSPQNVLVGVDGLARVTDFGVARAEARLHETTGASVKGKVAYMSPEQLEGAAVDRRSDLFSLGVVLWETLTGRTLFFGESLAETAHAVTHAPIPAPSLVLPGLPRSLDDPVQLALQRNPARRAATALEVADALERTSLPVATHREVGHYVQQLLADDLQRVRGTLASLPKLPMLAATPRQLASEARQRSTRSARPEPSSQRRLLALASVLSAAALLVVLAAVWPSGDATRSTGSPPDSARTAPRRSEDAGVVGPAAAPDARPGSSATVADLASPRPKLRRTGPRPRPSSTSPRGKTFQPDHI